MNHIDLNRSQYLELENIALGAFLPVKGFMNEDEFQSVVRNMRLPSGEVFPLPVVLDVSAAQARALRGQPRVSLVFGREVVAVMTPESIFSIDRQECARQIFGTTDDGHAGVQKFFAMESHFVGGPISLISRATLDISSWNLTPQQTRSAFAERDWKTVVGFQTRNIPHRAHEYLQRAALELADGLFIQPLVGWAKAGDYTPEAIMLGYQVMMEHFYPRGRVLLGALTANMRYAGPREAVFHAIIRRNYGCTHFVVGRDHAGVGNYYGKYEAHEYTRRFEGELGIKIVRLHGPYHCKACGGIVTERTCQHLETRPEVTQQISGSDIRAALSAGTKIDSEVIRPEVISALKDVPLFFRGVAK